MEMSCCCLFGFKEAQFWEALLIYCSLSIEIGNVFVEENQCLLSKLQMP